MENSYQENAIQGTYGYVANASYHNYISNGPPTNFAIQPQIGNNWNTQYERNNLNIQYVCNNLNTQYESNNWNTQYERNNWNTQYESNNIQSWMQPGSSSSFEQGCPNNSSGGSYRQLDYTNKATPSYNHSNGSSSSTPVDVRARYHALPNPRKRRRPKGKRGSDIIIDSAKLKYLKQCNGQKNFCHESQKLSTKVAASSPSTQLEKGRNSYSSEAASSNQELLEARNGMKGPPLPHNKCRMQTTPEAAKGCSTFTEGCTGKETSVMTKISTLTEELKGLLKQVNKEDMNKENLNMLLSANNILERSVEIEAPSNNIGEANSPATSPNAPVICKTECEMDHSTTTDDTILHTVSGTADVANAVTVSIPERQITLNKVKPEVGNVSDPHSPHQTTNLIEADDKTRRQNTPPEVGLTEFLPSPVKNSLIVINANKHSLTINPRDQAVNIAQNAKITYAKLEPSEDQPLAPADLLVPAETSTDNVSNNGPRTASAVGPSPTESNSIAADGQKFYQRMRKRISQAFMKCKSLGMTDELAQSRAREEVYCSIAAEEMARRFAASNVGKRSVEIEAPSNNIGEANRPATSPNVPVICKTECEMDHSTTNEGAIVHAVSGTADVANAVTVPIIRSKWVASERVLAKRAVRRVQKKVSQTFKRYRSLGMTDELAQSRAREEVFRCVAVYQMARRFAASKVGKRSVEIEAPNNSLIEEANRPATSPNTSVICKTECEMDHSTTNEDAILHTVSGVADVENLVAVSIVGSDIGEHEKSLEESQIKCISSLLDLGMNPASVGKCALEQCHRHLLSKNAPERYRELNEAEAEKTTAESCTLTSLDGIQRKDPSVKDELSMPTLDDIMSLTKNWGFGNCSYDSLTRLVGHQRDASGGVKLCSNCHPYLLLLDKKQNELYNLILYGSLAGQNMNDILQDAELCNASHVKCHNSPVPHFPSKSSSMNCDVSNNSSAISITNDTNNRTVQSSSNDAVMACNRKGCPQTVGAWGNGYESNLIDALTERTFGNLFEKFKNDPKNGNSVERWRNVNNIADVFSLLHPQTFNPLKENIRRSTNIL